MAYPAIAGEFRLEGFEFGPEHEPARSEDASKGLAQFPVQRGMQRFEVEKCNAHVRRLLASARNCS